MDGRAVSLTPIEFLIVECLLQNRGKTVSREMLDELIGISDNNKTDVYVCYLRRKFRELTPIPMIQTVRGKGYMMK
jgi:two-component system OmpR family response regulator